MRIARYWGIVEHFGHSAGCLTCLKCSDCNLVFSDAWLLLMPLLLVAASLHVASTLLCSARVRGYAGIPLPRLWSLVPGGDARQVARWSRHAVRPVLLHRAQSQYRGEWMAMPSLAGYAVFQPRLHGGNNIHFSRLPSSLLREWTLARCGHHTFQDGRSARHAHRHPECLCGTPCRTLLHAIRVCPLFDIQRHTWLERLGLQRVPFW